MAQQIDQKFSFGDKVSVEVHTSNGSNPQSPQDAPNVHPRAGTPAATKPVSGTFSGVRFQVPA